MNINHNLAPLTKIGRLFILTAIGALIASLILAIFSYNQTQLTSNKNLQHNRGTVIAYPLQVKQATPIVSWTIDHWEP